VPEALTNTLRIAEMCDLKLDFNTSKYPAYEPPPGSRANSTCASSARVGLRKRYGDRAGNDQELRQRLDYELSILEKTGFTSYFLIVWDFNSLMPRYLMESQSGPGRGSAAGLAGAYVLEITDLDPLRFGLIFERFS